MNKGVATPTVVTFNRHVVDLQPIQNGFLHFSSACLSFRLFLGAFCLFTRLDRFVLNQWARKKRSMHIPK